MWFERLLLFYLIIWIFRDEYGFYILKGLFFEFFKLLLRVVIYIEILSCCFFCDCFILEIVGEYGSWS